MSDARIQVIKSDKTIKPDVNQIHAMQQQIASTKEETKKKADEIKNKVSQGNIPKFFSSEMLTLVNQIIFHAVGTVRRCPQVWDLDDEDATVIGKASARWANARLGPYIGFLAPELELLAAYASIGIKKVTMEKMFKAGMIEHQEETEVEEHPLEDRPVEVGDIDPEVFM